MGEHRVLRLSHATTRALSTPRPHLRGRLHQGAAVLALPGAIAWISMTPAGAGRWAVATFGLGITAMLGFSGLLHLRVWDERTHERLLRLDHSGIYLAISGTGVAVALVGLEGWPRVVLLAGMAIGALAGVISEWLPFATPRGLNHATALTLGWTPVVLMPWLWSTAGPSAVALLAIGGVFYTVGAILVGARWPGRTARWFGYHEVFHVLVIMGALAHGIMVAQLVHGS